MQVNPFMSDNESEIVNQRQHLGSLKKLILFNNIRLRLLEQLCFLDVKAESHSCFVNELSTFFRHRALVELEHSRGLEKLLSCLQSNTSKPISKSCTQLSSPTTYSSWNLLIKETNILSNDYNLLSEIYNVEVIFKLQKVLHLYKKYYELIFETHEEILRILRNFYTTVTTYAIYKKNQCSSDKLETAKSRSIYKHFTETSNADIHKNMLRDLRDIIYSMDLGFGLMISKAILAHVNSEQKLFKHKLKLNEENSSQTDMIKENESAGKNVTDEDNNSVSRQKNLKLLRQFHQENGNDTVENLLNFEFHLHTQLLVLKEKKIRKNLEVIYGILDTREMKAANSVKAKKAFINDYSTQIEVKPKISSTKSLSNSSLSTVIKQISFKTNSNTVHTENKVRTNPSSGHTRPKLFGGSLEEYIQITNEKIPLIIRSCIRVISTYGLQSQGIFRVSGSQIEIMNFRESFERGEDPLAGATDASDMNSVAGVLKLYLRELKEPLFPSKYFNLFISLKQLESEQEVVGEMKRFFKAISPPVVVVIRFLFSFLNHLSEYANENMMDAFNLAISFGPTLMPTPEDRKQVQYQTQLNELIKVIIIHHQEVFPADLAGPQYHRGTIENYLSDTAE